MRIAAIDIGTNSIHMVIADATGPTGFEVVDREREVVQVGRGSFPGGRLRADAIKRTVDALQRFVQLARRHVVDHIVCTATAAVREAKNGHDFLTAARLAAGVSPRVIPASEEGRLIYLGVKSALQLDARPILIVDIGGGSMQLVVGDRERCRQVVSAPLGALRLTETMLTSDPPSRRDLQRLRRLIKKTARDSLAGVLEYRPRQVYGSSGSIHALAQVSNWLETGGTIEHINGHVLTLRALERTVRHLERLTTKERERLPGIDSRRAEIIVPGGLVLVHVLEQAKVDAITISDYGVREGLVTDFVLSHGQEISALSKVEDLRLRSVLQCLVKFRGNGLHAEHVARLSLELFDELRPWHDLGDHEREMLHFAGLLHDIGASIAYDGHGEHSYYIIKNANLRGFTPDELELIANVARYHGKARPRKRDESYRALAKPERRIVRWLAAMLRIAEGLDRSHYQLIRSVRVTARPGQTTIWVVQKGDAQLEIWGADQRTELLEELLDHDVRLAAAPAETKRAPAARTTPRPARRARSNGRAPERARASARRVRAPAGPAA